MTWKYIAAQRISKAENQVGPSFRIRDLKCLRRSTDAVCVIAAVNERLPPKAASG